MVFDLGFSKGCYIDNFGEGAILKCGRGGGEPPSDETIVQRWRGSNKESVSFNTKKIKEEKQGSIMKTREAVTLSLDTVKLCASKYYIERSQGQWKKGFTVGKNDLNNCGNLVELLWHRV